MPITELATLRLKPGKGWNDIISHIRVLEREQAAWSGYPLYLFDVSDSHNEFILLSGWRSVEAHHEWIASEMNQNLLVVLGPFIDVASLLHLTIEPNEAWKDARIMLYEKGNEGERTEDSAPLKDVIWEGKGADCEGNTKDVYRLCAFSSNNALGGIEQGSLLIRRDINIPSR